MNGIRRSASGLPRRHLPVGAVTLVLAAGILWAAPQAPPDRIYVNAKIWTGVAASPSAQAMAAEKLIYLTDVDGLLADVSDRSSLISRIEVDAVRDMIASGALSGGMIPKARACIDAVEAGVRSVHMVNGTLPHVLLLELFTDEGVGTMITTPDDTKSE